MAETAVEQGAVLLNYCKVTSLLKQNGMLNGIVAVDQETGKEHQLTAKAIINATGVYTDSIRKMDDPESKHMIVPSQGVHIVLDKSFLPGSSAIMVPHTDDGRVLFAIPWHDKVIVGTTDTPVKEIPLNPVPMDEEIEFLLTHAARYLTKDPAPQDVQSAFAGLRPLVSMGNDENTAAISRDHTLHISNSGLVTIAGGKWTTYRKMAEDTVDHALEIAGLPTVPCSTHNLQIHGYHKHADKFGDLACYGSDAIAIQTLFYDNPKYTELLHHDLPFKTGEVVWAVRNEMARTVEDFLSRRTRTLLLNARASIEMTPKVAQIMADELGKKKAWQKEQVETFTSIAKEYILE